MHKLLKKGFLQLVEKCIKVVNKALSRKKRYKLLIARVASGLFHFYLIFLKLFLVQLAFIVHCWVNLEKILYQNTIFQFVFHCLTKVC